MPNISNEQKLVNICFSVAMLMHDPEYADSFKKMSQEELANWVAAQLASSGFKTVPCGALWGLLQK